MAIIKAFGPSMHLRKANCSDPRAKYRMDFLKRAARGKIVTLEEYDPFRVEWWNAVDDMVRREFGDFFTIDRRVSPKSTYINPKWLNMPSYLRVDLKGHLGQVDLWFKNVEFDALASVVAAIMPPEFKLVENSKSSALRIDSLQPFFASDGLGVIETRVRSAYEAAVRLLNFWKANQEAFDRLASEAYRHHHP